ncbi:hypothetical protein SAPIO_CDS2781 [Scedosporium apiospermum]|uniref:CFEM domain-containing protein n=1 Tax=Pseudallescheria apiosperma TaxID=563466 RepID=A0A084GBI7_PSEDA|nr:uncharacterized protein SAPIO_CDS2781 [Scedosporium apiospermum]KEZ44699.1 hypothetical protein SAPIO_CDS2781 [Scedosporium apiospermum]
MKTATFAAITMASVAAAIPMCAINCFTNVITEHPPLDCTEPDMYHCFCKMPSLQQYFLECSYSSGTCATEAEGAEAVAFGVDLCSQLGLPITIDTKPPTKPTSTPPTEPTTQPPAETTGSEPEPTESKDPEPEPTASDDTSVEPTGSASASASGTGSGPVPSGTSGSDTPVIVNAANGKAVSGLLAAAGLVAALI